MTPRIKPKFGSPSDESVSVGTAVDTLHELKEKGIHGSPKPKHCISSGVLSVIVSQQDKDYGHFLTLVINSSVTLQSKFHPVNCFLTNSLDKKPIRVIRARNVEGQYSPLYYKYRYDGLFKVELVTDDETTLFSKTKTFYVHLKHLANQPVFWENPPMPKYIAPRNMPPVEFEYNDEEE